MSGNGFFSGFGKFMFVGFLASFVFVVVAVLVWMGYVNGEVDLRNQFQRQEKTVSLSYDKLWKKISQQAQVVEASKDAFKDVVGSMVQSRYDGKNPAFLFIQEQNPGYTLAEFRTLMNTISAEREGFFHEQKKLLDIKYQHDNLRRQFPGSLVVGHQPELEAKLITSTKTEETVRTGREDDVEIPLNRQNGQ